MPRVMGVDPGFANTGIVGVEFDKDLHDSRIIYKALVRTQKSAKKLNIRKNSDAQRRHSEVGMAFNRALGIIQPDVISMESVSFVRNASTMCNIGGAWYGLYYMVLGLPIHMVDYTPQELKVAATGKKTASKQDMIDAVEAQWPGQMKWDDITKSKREHVADAAIAAWAAIVDRAIPWNLINKKR